MQIVNNRLYYCSLALLVAVYNCTIYNKGVVFIFLYLLLLCIILDLTDVKFSRKNGYNTFKSSLLCTFLYSVKLYISKFNLKYLYQLISKSLFFRVTIGILCYLLTHVDLLTYEQFNVIVSIIIISYYLLNLIKHSSNLHEGLHNCTTLLLALLVLSMSWITIGLCLEIITYSYAHITDYILYIGDKGTSESEPSNSSTTEGEGKGKRPKPNLKIEIGPKTDLEKDLNKLGNCSHKDVGSFEAKSEEDVKSTLCDFTSESDLRNKPLQHQAFDYVQDKALLCNDCQAIICKNCYDEPSSDSENDVDV